MYEFVKSVDEPNIWSLRLTKDSDVDYQAITEFFHTKLVQLVEANTRKECKEFGFVAPVLEYAGNKIMTARMTAPPYKQFVNKYNEIRIRPTGTWGDTSKIIETQFVSDLFIVPSDVNKIVVCENDLVAEPFWIEYLQKRFNQPITVINLFGGRSIKELKQLFQQADYITFSTTFTSTNWFSNLIEGIDENMDKVIIGYCHGDDNWNNNYRIYPILNEFKGVVEIISQQELNNK